MKYQPPQRISGQTVIRKIRHILFQARRRKRAAGNDPLGSWPSVIINQRLQPVRAPCVPIIFKCCIMLPRCTRAGTPDNSADVDYDHFPEESCRVRQHSLIMPQNYSELVILSGIAESRAANFRKTHRK